MVPIVILLLILQHSTGFGVNPPTVVKSQSSTTSTHLNGMFQGLGDAFKSDEKLGKPQNAGLKNGPQYNDNVTVNGKPVQGAVVGQKLTVVAAKNRVKIPVNCQQGDCGTCMVKFNGRKVKGAFS